MIPPPDQLDGAPVLRYAIFPPHISPTGATRHLVDGKFMSPVAALAICLLPREEGYALCYCDEDWKVLARGEHATFDAALQQVEFENDGVLPNWRPAREERR